MPSLGLAVALYGAPAQAQAQERVAPPTTASPAELAALRQQITELQKRLDALEAAQKTGTTPTPSASGTTPSTGGTTAPIKPAAAPTPVVTASKLPVTLSGLLQVQSLDYPHEDINNNGQSSHDTFRLRRGEVRITAPTITSKISGTIMFDLAKFTSGAGNTTNIRARDNVLQEIQLSMRLNQNKLGSNFIDIGQFKIPVGNESLVSSAALPFTERSLIFTQRDPFDGGYGDVRDMGVQLRGSYTFPRKFGQLEYRGGIFNGLGDRQNALALSDQKAFLGWLGYRPTYVPGLLIGISGGKGNTGVQTTSGATVVTTRDDRDLRNAFLNYKLRRFSLQSEYLKGKAAPIIVAASTVAGRDIEGYYFGGGYFVTPKLELVARYDHLNTDRSQNDADVNDLLGGFNYYIKDNNAKIQLNIVKRDGGDNAPTNINPVTNLRNDRIELRSGFQVSF